MEKWPNTPVLKQVVGYLQNSMAILHLLLI